MEAFSIRGHDVIMKSSLENLNHQSNNYVIIFYGSSAGCGLYLRVVFGFNLFGFVFSTTALLIKLFALCLVMGWSMNRKKN